MMITKGTKYHFMHKYSKLMMIFKATKLHYIIKMNISQVLEFESHLFENNHSKKNVSLDNC